MGSSLVTVMIKIITAQTQQMVLYFTAEEIRAPLQCGLKEIWVTMELKAASKDGLYWTTQNTSEVTKESCAINSRVIKINTVTRRNEDKTQCSTEMEMFSFKGLHLILTGNKTWRAILDFSVSWKWWQKANAPRMDHAIVLKLKSFDILLNFR